ncbi:MAG: AraC family transcriptional regulator [Kiritimatiellia bacterium]|jgi:AraC family transcriptional regulator
MDKALKLFTWRDADAFFTPAVLELLSDLRQWRLVTPYQALPSASGRPSADTLAWLRRHQHVHPFHEVLLVVGGSSWHGVQDRAFRCRPGVMVMTAPNQPHVNRYHPSDDGLRHIWARFIAAEHVFLQFVIVRRGRVHRVYGERSFFHVGDLGRRLSLLRTVADGGDPAATLNVKLLLIAFFADLLRLIIEYMRRPGESIDRDELLRKKIKAICGHIRQTGGVNASLAGLAEVAGYSPGHFARVFKQNTGQTVHQYIDACRLERAKILLADKMPGKRMAAELGFADKTTLSRWLNKYRNAL